MKAKFKAVVELDLNFVQDEGAYVKECSSYFTTSDNVEPKLYVNEDGSLTENGYRAKTLCLVQGLISNMHTAHQLNIVDSAKHYREILAALEEGFLCSSIEIIK